MSEEDHSNAAGGMIDKIKSCLPDVSNLYLQPLNPSSDMGLSDRANLIVQSARPWREFFDISNFNIPPLGQIRSRVEHNVETYLYNYFLLTCIHLVFFSIVHLGAVLALIAWLAVIYLLYIVNPEDISVADKFIIDSKWKMAIAVITGLMALFVGHVFTLLTSVAVFLLIVVGIHGIIRDDTNEAVADITV